MEAGLELRLVDGRSASDALLASLAGWLSERELARYRRFVRPDRQRQFLIGRLLARQVLGELLGVAPQDLLIEEVAGQKPVLAGIHPSADFSISHSGPWVACAASLDAKVGLDIECIDPARNILALAEQAFGPVQVAWLNARPAASRVRDFYNLWSASEARIKLGADGECMHICHDEIAIALCCATPGVALRTDLAFNFLPCGK